MKKLLITATALFAMSASANAAVIVALPGGTALPIPATNSTNTATPLPLAPGVVAAPAPGSTFTPGYPGYYGFNSNGGWNGTSMIGLDKGEGYFTIDFLSPISAFLGELNWTTFNKGDASVEIYGINGLLESLTLENAGVNAVTPGFYGFSRGSSEITSVRFNNEYIGVRNVSTLAVAAVPEPAAWIMMIIGMAGVGFSMRRKEKQALRVRYA